jgi:hypothetical protein
MEGLKSRLAQWPEAEGFYDLAPKCMHDRWEFKEFCGLKDCMSVGVSVTDCRRLAAASISAIPVRAFVGSKSGTPSAHPRRSAIS